MKASIKILKENKLITINQCGFGMTITEAHSFLKDFIHILYDYHKYFPEEKVGNYIGEAQNA